MGIPLRVGLISLSEIMKAKDQAGNKVVGQDTFLFTMLTERTIPAGFILPESEQYLKRFFYKIIFHIYEQRLLKSFLVFITKLKIQTT